MDFKDYWTQYGWPDKRATDEGIAEAAWKAAKEDSRQEVMKQKLQASKNPPRRWTITSQKDDDFAPALEGPPISVGEAKSGIPVIEDRDDMARIRIEMIKELANKHEKISAWVIERREEILIAFMAKYNLEPDQVEQVEFQGENGLVWSVRSKDPASAIPLPIEIVYALQASERALMGLGICMDKECGSDPCDAYQQIVAILPDDQRVNVNCAQVSHRTDADRVTAKSLLEWFKACPGASWLATIKDLEEAIPHVLAGTRPKGGVVLKREEAAPAEQGVGALDLILVDALVQRVVEGAFHKELGAKWNAAWQRVRALVQSQAARIVRLEAVENEGAGEFNAAARAEGYSSAMHRHIVREMVRWWPNGSAAFPGGEKQAKSFLDTWDLGRCEVRGGPDAEALVRSMVTFLATDASMGEEMLPTDRAWLVMAQEYIKGRSIEQPKANGREMVLSWDNGVRDYSAQVWGYFEGGELRITRIETLAPEPDDQMISLGCAYGNLLIQVHDLRNAVTKVIPALEKVRTGISKGQGEWPYIDRELLQAKQALEVQMDRKVGPAAGPLPGCRWRYSQGQLFCGTMRLMKDDWDTNPVEGFKEEVMGWACGVLNNASGESA